MLPRLLIPLTGLLCLLMVETIGLGSLFSNSCQDLLFRLRGPLAPPQSVIIIGIDERSLTALGAWPFPRTLHGRLLSRLNQARAVGFDVLFSEATPEDPDFNAAMATAPPVILATATSRDGRLLRPAASLGRQADTGHVETIFDGDGVVRRRLSPHPSGQPSFARAMLQAGGIPFPGQQPTDAGDRPLINFYGPEQTFLTLSYLDVLNGIYPEALFKDRWLLVGAAATGLHDTFLTPFSRSQVTPGVEIQATILANLLEDRTLHPLREAALLLVGLVLLLAIFLWPRTGEGINITVNLVFTGLVLLAALFFFQHNQLVEISWSLLLLWFSYLFHLVHQVFWTARTLARQILQLDRQLDQRLRQSYPTPETVASQGPARKSLFSPTGIQQHIQQLQDAADAITLQHRFLDDLLQQELPPLALWEAASGRLILANDRFQGFWQQQVIGAETTALLPDYPTFLLEIERLRTDRENPGSQPLSQDKTSPLRLEIQTMGRRGRHVFQTDIHCFNSTRPTFGATLAVFQDITQLRELARVRGELVSIVSHELKLPLTTIRGYAEMLENELRGEPLDYAREISLQAERLNTLIAHFLEINRLESGKQELRRHPFSPLSMVNDALNSILPLAKGKNIRLSTDIPQRTSPLVGDELLLLQAVINLLDNAVKFSPAGSTINLELQEEPERFTITVQDQGPGIPEECRRDIFKKFHRGLATGDRQGFGLGLNLVQEVIHRHQGEIRLNRIPQGGARFSLILPKELR
ncbi:CHASE2 domain-containing protein [Desulfogranum mediterraneum]|uniref:CHASE2 domain-containing protein n=1 Tax=Desulfogranum mediterraneum TaxID=160661 RepID=UPI0004273403|nr:CHASE2 domain-containing protein [Desulfogranum mediterraneum]